MSNLGYLQSSLKDTLLSVSLFCHLASIVLCTLILSETLALYKSFTYLLNVFFKSNDHSSTYNRKCPGYSSREEMFYFRHYAAKFLILSCVMYVINRNNINLTYTKYCCTNRNNYHNLTEMHYFQDHVCKVSDELFRV